MSVGSSHGFYQRAFKIPPESYIAVEHVKKRVLRLNFGKYVKKIRYGL